MEIPPSLYQKAKSKGFAFFMLLYAAHGEPGNEREKL